MVRVILEFYWDSNKVLLKKIKYVNEEPTVAFLPDFCEDISIYTSPASKYVTLAGAIGIGDLTTAFSCQIQLLSWVEVELGLWQYIDNIDIYVICNVNVENTYSSQSHLWLALKNSKSTGGG